MIDFLRNNDKRGEKRYIMKDESWCWILIACI